MAQLIKLHDYVSRYEWNIYRYPSQFIRLKQTNWKSLYNDWLQEQNREDEQEKPYHPFKKRFMDIKERLFTSTKKLETDNISYSQLIHSEAELRKYFLDQLYSFQIKWATSTITEISILEKDYENDRLLKYFLQRFPDIYLIMYKPVFYIKNAPVDGEIIMISPTHIEIITLLEFEPDVVIISGDHRTWMIEKNNDIQSIISPTIALKRTEHMLMSIFAHYNIQFPIKKTVLSRRNDILFTTEPYQMNIIGKREYSSWLQEKRSLSAPLKNAQLKVAGVLLDFCISSSVKRSEWEDNRDSFL